MPGTLIKVDLTQSAYSNEVVHNRWHPDIRMAAWVNPGDDFIVETYDWTGGFIKITAFATNEGSANEPHLSSAGHGTGCGCCRGPRAPAKADAPNAAKSFPARPWMILH